MQAKFRDLRPRQRPRAAIRLPRKPSFVTCEPGSASASAAAPVSVIWLPSNWSAVTCEPGSASASAAAPASVIWLTFRSSFVTCEPGSASASAAAPASVIWLLCKSSAETCEPCSLLQRLAGERRRARVGHLVAVEVELRDLRARQRLGKRHHARVGNLDGEVERHHIAVCICRDAVPLAERRVCHI